MNELVPVRRGETVVYTPPRAEREPYDATTRRVRPAPRTQVVEVVDFFARAGKTYEPGEEPWHVGDNAAERLYAVVRREFGVAAADVCFRKFVQALQLGGA